MNKDSKAYYTFECKFCREKKIVPATKENADDKRSGTMFWELGFTGQVFCDI